ncbi:hypothetical protein [Brachybacterium sp. P6-10-X1]|nr:hypothetical protein [Brachybacterium sp. P6-10-X1]
MSYPSPGPTADLGALRPHAIRPHAIRLDADVTVVGVVLGVTPIPLTGG